VLFSDRKCFTLVRPLNNESQLQCLDQIPVSTSTIQFIPFFLIFFPFFSFFLGGIGGRSVFCLLLIVIVFWNYIHGVQLEKLRPEFRSGSDALRRFVFERTRLKQLGATVMNGHMLASITQSFLDALNHGVVPTITSSWQASTITYFAWHMRKFNVMKSKYN